jgi:hypothetical protein
LATLTKLLRKKGCFDLPKSRRTVDKKELPDILRLRQSLSFFTPFAGLSADLRLFRFNPSFSLSRLLTMVTEKSFAPTDEGRAKFFIRRPQS